jgi:hypothetical protein
LTIDYKGNEKQLVVVIYDFLGKKIDERKCSFDGQIQILSTQHLPKGIYQVFVSGESGTWSSKWVKE